MRVLTRRVTLAVVLVVALPAIGCGSQQEDLGPALPPQIKLVPATTTIGLGQNVQFSVEGHNLPTATGGFLWRTADEAVVQVTSSGQATGVSKGRAFIFVLLAADTSLTARAEVIVE